MTQTAAISPYAKANFAFRLIRQVVRWLLAMLFKVELQGLERLPDSGGYLLACNHLSWLDGILLLAYLPAEPRIHYLAAAEMTVGHSGPIPLLVKLVGGVIPVDRQSHRGDRAAVVQSLRVLREGGVLGIFPEGRCGEHEGLLLSLKDGAASFALKTGRPIQIVGLSGTLELCFRKRIRLQIGPLVEPAPGETHDELLERVAMTMTETIPSLHPSQPKHKYLTWLSHLL